MKLLIICSSPAATRRAFAVGRQAASNLAGKRFLTSKPIFVLEREAGKCPLVKTLSPSDQTPSYPHPAEKDEHQNKKHQVAETKLAFQDTWLGKVVQSDQHHNNINRHNCICYNCKCYDCKCYDINKKPKDEDTDFEWGKGLWSICDEAQILKYKLRRRVVEGRGLWETDQHTTEILKFKQRKTDKPNNNKHNDSVREDNNKHNDSVREDNNKHNSSVREERGLWGEEILRFETTRNNNNKNSSNDNSTTEALGLWGEEILKFETNRNNSNKTVVNSEIKTKNSNNSSITEGRGLWGEEIHRFKTNNNRNNNNDDDIDDIDDLAPEKKNQRWFKKENKDQIWFCMFEEEELDFLRKNFTTLSDEELVAFLMEEDGEEIEKDVC